MAVVDTGGADKPSAARRVMHILGAVLVAVVLPALLIGALVGRLGVAAMLTGLVLGVVGSKIGGARRMLYVAPVIGVAAGLGAFSAYVAALWQWHRSLWRLATLLDFRARDRAGVDADRPWSDRVVRAGWGDD
jgi:hypothetical protein